MNEIQLSEILNLVEYEKVRESMRARIIQAKQPRRVALGDQLSLLFENRDTVLFQIQEMVRTERIVDEAKILDELAAYNALIPGPSQLSATLFIEIPDIVRMTSEQARRAVGRFMGLEQGALSLRLGGDLRVPAEFEAGHSSEEKMAAVHYLRFSFSERARRALTDAGVPAEIVVDHANYQAAATVRPELRAEMLADLA